MEIKSQITFIYDTEKEALICLGSLKPDNMNFVNAHVQKNNLICEMESRSLKSMIATMDDLIFCELMAEKIMEFTNNEKTRN